MILLATALVAVAIAGSQLFLLQQRTSDRELFECLFGVHPPIDWDVRAEAIQPNPDDLTRRGYGMIRSTAPVLSVLAGLHIVDPRALREGHMFGAGVFGSDESSAGVRWWPVTFDVDASPIYYQSDSRGRLYALVSHDTVYLIVISVRGSRPWPPWFACAAVPARL